MSRATAEYGLVKTLRPRRAGEHDSGDGELAAATPPGEPLSRREILAEPRYLTMVGAFSIAMLAQISFLFGGRIAEEIFVHDISTGASNDFERATQLARDMVTRFGMSDSMGPMVYGENEGEVFLGRSVTKIGRAHV